MDSLSILIKSILQAPSDAEINKVKLELENKLKNININTSGKGIKILDDKEIDIYVQKMQNQLSRLQIGKGKVFENAGVQEELNKFTQSLELFRNKGAISAKEVGLQFDNLKTKVAQISGEFKNVNKDGYAFSDMITLAAKKLIIWKVAGDAIFAVIRLLKQIPDIVSKIDASLTEVNKVLDLSTSQMKALAEEATNLGIAYGKTTVEVINSIGSFAKAGLDQETSKQFASLAALLSNVGNISTEVAEKTLIMANAGYQLGNDYKTLNGLISQFNELANRNAIEVNTLSEAWQVSASVAKQAKLNIEDYNALITVAGSTSQRSGREIGNALRTWLMRLQGVTDGTDTLEEDVSKVDKVLGELGIQLRKTPTEFRPAMEVITEIAAKYRELGEAGETVKQSELLEALAGKYRANIVAGVLSNFDDISKALDDQTNSFMSAEKENSRYMDSIQARTKALQAQWELFASKTLDSSVIKSVVELGKVLVQVLDSGFVRFIGTTALLTAGIYGLTLAYKKVTASTLAYNIQQNLLMITTNGLKATVKSLWATLSVSPLFWITAAVVAVQGLVWVFDALNVTVEEQKQKVEDAQQAYNKTKTEIQSLNTELETTKQQIDELNAKDKLSLVEENELERLQLTNEELKTRLALLEKEEEINARKVADEQTKLYNKQFGKYDFSERQVKEYIDNAQISGNNAILLAEEKNVSALIAAYKQFSDLKQEALSAENTDDIEHFSGILQEIEDSLVASEKELLTTKDILSALKNPTEEQQKILAQIESALLLINNIILPDIGKKTIVPVTKDDIDTIQDYNSAVKKSQEAIDDFSSSAKTLSSVWKTLNDSENLSAETMLGLIKKYPEYTQQILKANENREDAIKLTNILFEIEKERAIKVKQDEADILSARLANVQALIAQMTLNYSHIGNDLPYDQFIAKVKEQAEIKKALADAQATIDALKDWKPSDFGSGSGSSSKSKYTPSTEESALKALYDAQLINLDEYLSRLLKLESEKYSEYKNKSSKQIEEMLRSRNEDVAKKTSEYLSLSGTISDLQNNKISLSFESYDKEIKDLNDSISSLGNINTLSEKSTEAYLLGVKFQYAEQELAKVKKQLTDPSLTSSMKELLQDREVKLKLDITNFKDGIEEATREYLELEKKNQLAQLDLDYNKNLREKEEAIYGKDSSKSIYEAQAQSRIDNIQNVIDALEKQADAENEILERQEKQKAIKEAELKLIEAQQKLLNAQKNKSTQILNKQDDGTFQYEYVADIDVLQSAQKDVESAQEKLSQTNEDYNKWEKQTAKKHQIDILKSQIEYEQRIMREKANSYNLQKAVLDTALNAEKLAVENHFIDMDKLVVEEMTNLKNTYKEKWDEIIRVVTEKLGVTQAMNRQLEADLLEAQRIAAAIAAAQAAAAASAMSMSGGGAVYDTGGLFPSGRTAINLSGKPEYILDPNATKSFISFTNLLKKMDVTRMFNISTPSFNLPEKSQLSTPQVIHIDRVEFPNATNANEIEKAIKNLPMNAKVKAFAT